MNFLQKLFLKQHPSFQVFHCKSKILHVDVIAHNFIYCDCTVSSFLVSTCTNFYIDILLVCIQAMSHLGLNKLKIETHVLA